MKEKELRKYSGEIRADGEKRTVEGYALLFDTPSTGLPWQESISRGALDGVLDKSDVKCWMNHDESRGLLARWPMKEGSLHLEIDERGLLYRFEAPKTALGDELLENIHRGEINESSFAFICKDCTWEGTDSDNMADWKRTITGISELYDVSPVYDAAYSATSVYARSINNVAEEIKAAKKSAKKEEEEKIKKEEQVKEEPQDDYYNELKKYIDI